VVGDQSLVPGCAENLATRCRLNSCELVVPMGKGGGYKMHGRRRIFLGFYGDEIGVWGRRTGSVTWDGAENGEVFAIR
jgi:hypothetical protein